MADNTLLYTAVYDNLDDALDDLNGLEMLHEDCDDRKVRRGGDRPGER